LESTPETPQTPQRFFGCSLSTFSLLMAGQKAAETSRNQQKKRMGQSGIALQYSQNHDGIEGYFNPVGGAEGFLKGKKTAYAT
jgi:hypothetical protein